MASTNKERMLTRHSQTRTRSMAQQPTTVEHHQSRAMRYGVSPIISCSPFLGLVLTPLEHSAALCQIFDSIYLDVPMSRVKFNVNTEYAYLQNFKILQSKYLPLNHMAYFNTYDQAASQGMASIDPSMSNSL
jgi:hypothetical protein